MIVFQIWKIIVALAEFFKKVNILQVEASKNPTTPLHSEIKKLKFLEQKSNKKRTCF